MATTGAIGITLPFQLGKTGDFEQSVTAMDQVKSNLVSLLLTRKGERPFQPDLGSDLYTLLFTQMDDEYNANVQSAIQRAVAKWLPFVNLTQVEVSRDDDRNLTTVKIDFSLSSNTNITDSVIIEF